MEDDNSEASADVEADDVESESVAVTDEGVMTPTPPPVAMDSTRIETYPSAMGSSHTAQTPRANGNTNSGSAAERLDDTTLTPNAPTAQTVAE